MSARFKLDPRLLADTDAIGELPLSDLLLMNDARFPWLILVPRIAGARELIDLDERDQQTLLGEINLIGRALETLLRPDKLNIAALGNIVAQLHVHVIARFAEDAAWPQPVWGHGERILYTETERASRIAKIRAPLRGVLA
ncbi:MAG TPA: HIT domain-containing protein [Rhodanobacteraceae bacterium]|jgi:diadenosine tetraphosphate (Ap4A) HIT family hydrolase|nr:HIT domain-containing protein [Rhodanobacteraceae bacterium]